MPSFKETAMSDNLQVITTMNVSTQGLGRAKLDASCSGEKLWVANVGDIVSGQAVVFPYARISISYLTFSILQKIYTSELLHLVT